MQHNLLVGQHSAGAFSRCPSSHLSIGRLVHSQSVRCLLCIWAQACLGKLEVGGAGIHAQHNVRSAFHHSKKFLYRHSIVELDIQCSTAIPCRFTLDLSLSLSSTFSTSFCAGLLCSAPASACRTSDGRAMCPVVAGSGARHGKMLKVLQWQHFLSPVALEQLDTRSIKYIGRTQKSITIVLCTCITSVWTSQMYTSNPATTS